MGCAQSGPNIQAQRAPQGGPRQIHVNRTGGIHRPLTVPLPWLSSKPISREALSMKREEFWNTRCTGHQQVWDAIKVASELLRNSDVNMANTILEAAQITTPNGSLGVCYDARGQKYEVDAYCYSNPTSFQEGVQEIIENTDKGRKDRQTKVGQKICVRARLYIDEIEIELATHEHELVKNVKELLFEATKTWSPGDGEAKPDAFPIETTRMRMFANGFELSQDLNPVSAYNVADNDVIQVMVRS